MCFLQEQQAASAVQRRAITQTIPKDQWDLEKAANVNVMSDTFLEA